MKILYFPPQFSLESGTAKQPEFNDVSLSGKHRGRHYALLWLFPLHYQILGVNFGVPDTCESIWEQYAASPYLHVRSFMFNLMGSSASPLQYLLMINSISEMMD